VVVDEGWWWTPEGDSESVDGWGVPTPHPFFYPSAAGGRGWAPIAAAIHALGLKFGVWTIRGIPAVAVANNLPIAGVNATARDAVGSPTCNCPWNDHTVATNAPSVAANAYYDSVAAALAAQGVDFVKLDCMFPTSSAGPYYDGELAAYTAALARYNLTVSLSPGTTVTAANASWVAANRAAATYRVTNDLWDVWMDPYGPTGYPTGLRSKLDVAAEFAAWFGVNGTWPDLDMLPLGELVTYANGGWSLPLSPTALTPGQQVLAMTLWAMTGAPMMLGGRLPLAPNDTATLALLTNAEVLGVHDNATRRAPLPPTSGGVALSQYAWTATGGDGSVYVALFNGDTWEQEIDVNLTDAGLAPGSGPWCGWDVWGGYWVDGAWNGSLWQWVAGESALLLRLAPCTTLSVSLQVNVSDAWRPVSPTLWAAFLEDINHAVEGGLSGQMVQDYQCSQVPGTAPVTLQPATTLYGSDTGGGAAYVQPCCGGAWVSTDAPLSPLDANYVVVTPGASGVPGSVSFMGAAGSSAAGAYLLADGTAGGGLLVAPPNASDPNWAAAATFIATPLSPTNPYLVTLAATLPALAGALLSVVPPGGGEGGGACAALPACCYAIPVDGCTGLAWVVDGGTPTSSSTWWYLGQPLSIGAAWQVAPAVDAGVALSVSQDGSLPFNANTSTSLFVRVDAPAPPPPTDAAGVCNTGFWGMAVGDGGVYNVTVWAAADAGTVPAATDLTFSLESAFGDVTYATAVLPLAGVPSDTWAPYGVVLTAAVPPGHNGSSSVDGNARLCVRLSSGGGGTGGGAWHAGVWLKALSCMLAPPPPSGAFAGLRADLAGAVAAMSPPVVRLPGGTFVCGTNMSGAYNVSATLGPWPTRPGHWDFWGYVAEDLVGYHEYLQFVEDLGADAVWVVNAGMSTSDAVPVADLAPWVDNALAAAAYALGNASSDYWAARRAAAGHPAPFRLAYLAIGNENCDGDVPTPTYAANYAAIAAAVRAAWPALGLIANCNMSGSGVPDALVDMWEYHTYQGLAANWIAMQYTWDGVPRSPSPRVFNSEYATIGEPGVGNLAGALGEAVWMLGLERNSDLVPMAAYAPLLTNVAARHWATDAINYNTTAWYGTPSYWNQVLFATYTPRTGAALLAYNLSSTAAPATTPTGFAPGVPLASSVASVWTSVLVDTGSGDVITKLVNYGGHALALNVSVVGAGGVLPPTATVATITALDARAGNSLADPTAVAITTRTVSTAGGVLHLPPLSINAITLPGAATNYR